MSVLYVQTTEARPVDAQLKETLRQQGWTVVEANKLPDTKDASVQLCIITPGVDKALPVRVTNHYDMSKVISLGPLKLPSKKLGPALRTA